MGALVANRYRVGDVLGHGAMGIVHRAYDEVLDREVALKELTVPDGVDAQEAADRFIVGARAAARLTHPSIVTVHDVISDDGRVLISMELLDGQTLGEILPAAGPLDSGTARQIGIAVAEALSEAHSRGVVHRDLKPENVFWLANGRVVVCDFGLARIGAGRGTQVGTVMGTPGYMAPEQIRGLEVGPQADVFAWGVLMYEMLAGRPPFGDADTDDAATLLYRVVNEHPPPFAVADGELATVVMWCLGKEPGQRPQQATEVVEALTGHRSITSGPPLAAMAETSPAASSDSTGMNAHEQLDALVELSHRSFAWILRRRFSAALPSVASDLLEGEIPAWLCTGTMSGDPVFLLATDRRLLAWDERRDLRCALGHESVTGIHVGPTTGLEPPITITTHDGSREFGGIPSPWFEDLEDIIQAGIAHGSVGALTAAAWALIEDPATVGLCLHCREEFHIAPEAPTCPDCGGTIVVRRVELAGPPVITAPASAPTPSDPPPNPPAAPPPPPPPSAPATRIIGAGSGSSPPTASESVVDRLERLARLHADGALSDAEYDAAKREVLSERSD